MGVRCTAARWVKREMSDTIRRRKGLAPPIHTADVSRNHYGSLETRRGKYFLRPRSFDFFLAPLHVRRARPPRIAGLEFLRHQGDGRKRLRRPTLLTGDVRLRNGAFFHREQRSSGQTIQNKHVTHLRVDRDGWRSILPGEQ